MDEFDTLGAGLALRHQPSFLSQVLHSHGLADGAAPERRLCHGGCA